MDMMSNYIFVGGLLLVFCNLIGQAIIGFL